MIDNKLRTPGRKTEEERCRAFQAQREIYPASYRAGQ